MHKVIWFASSNSNKILEVKKLLKPKGYCVKSLFDLPEKIEIKETGNSYQENALIKANTLAQIVKAPVIGDDTGLEIVALDHFPGLYSQRWKGSMTFYQAMENILQQMNKVTNRKAFMITAISYVDIEKKINKIFLGQLEGKITNNLSLATDGFGYDQIFYIPSKKATLYEMGPEEKNKISHRYQALLQLLNFLEQENN